MLEYLPMDLRWSPNCLRHLKTEHLSRANTGELLVKKFDKAFRFINSHVNRLAAKLCSFYIKRLEASDLYSVLSFILTFSYILRSVLFLGVILLVTSRDYVFCMSTQRHEKSAQ